VYDAKGRESSMHIFIIRLFRGAKVPSFLEGIAKDDKSDLAQLFFANAGWRQLGQEAGKVQPMDTRHECAIVDPEVGHVGNQEGQIIPQRSLNGSCYFNTIVSRHRPSQRPLSLDAQYIEDQAIVVSCLM
jgi:hypothetical protein